MNRLFLLLILLMTTLAHAKIVSCLFGEACTIPIDANGVISPVTFRIPGPYSDLSQVDKFNCIFYSANPHITLNMSAQTIKDGNPVNLPVVNTNNLIILSPNQSIPVNVSWMYPGKPHPGIKDINLITQASDKANPQRDSLAVMCIGGAK